MELNILKNYQNWKKKLKFAEKREIIGLFFLQLFLKSSKKSISYPLYMPGKGPIIIHACVMKNIFTLRLGTLEWNVHFSHCPNYLSVTRRCPNISANTHYISILRTVACPQWWWRLRLRQLLSPLKNLPNVHGRARSRERGNPRPRASGLAVRSLSDPYPGIPVHVQRKKKKTVKYLLYIKYNAHFCIDSLTLSLSLSPFSSAQGKIRSIFPFATIKIAGCTLLGKTVLLDTNNVILVEILVVALLLLYTKLNKTVV